MLHDLPTQRVMAGIRFAMAEQRLKTTELAARSGYSPSAVNRRLSGETPTSLEDLERFAQALGLRVTTSLTPIEAEA